ncbi:major facilitator superfamily domain-containing protein [Naematelia encephala]|uniref:Major facilitator superfamily domain-containing protein n=1 Tax=Naematelia encephala TaxID=71784 RepID=A0A1Y2B2T7_9TREE|nr:major facilitator superfamily domain-containing protein [Naematelia encephala]
MIDLGNGMEQVFVVDWLDHDPENPFNWSSAKKYANVIVAVLITTLTAANATSTAILAEWGPERFNCSREQYILSSTVFLITVAFTPLVLAPLSEVFGRMWIYQITGLINALLFIPQALSPSYSGLLAARWFQGMCASVGNSMVGGTVADLFFPKDRGLAMNVFSIMIFLGQSLGGFVFGWVGNGWGIQWCYGVQGIAAVVSCGLNALILRETRGDVLLARRAKALTKETGSKHICVADLQKQSFITLMRVSLIRPLEYLVTEPIVSAISTWIGFAWAIIFLGGTSVQLVFRAYGFSIGQAGTVQVCVFLGGVLGFISNFHQDRLYARAARKNGGRAPPEARLYWAAYGGLLFPLGMYVYAWTSRPGSIPWPVPAVFLTISYWGVFCMYSGTFTYLADAYETYSSSAQAAQSFARNFASGIFPLFGHQMYIAMGYPQATTLVASVALFLSIAPILLVRYGHVLRARSRVASALQREAEEAEK